ncbi:MAG: RNA polymerase sigma factor [Leucobacter sp.]
MHKMSLGDEAAYRGLFTRYERAVFRVALVLMHTTWDAEEVAATTFLELWRKRDSVRIVDGSILPWLMTVASYVAKNQQRSTRRYQRLLASLPRSSPTFDHADEVLQAMDSLRLSGLVRDALQGMNTRDASVFLLCVVQELPAREAALVLEIPEGTVKSRLSRVKSKLRDQLQHLSPQARRAEA